jgi:spore coat protein U domain-containing protein, fimbrial subunit CupE1/2/3/6
MKNTMRLSKRFLCGVALAAAATIAPAAAGGGGSLQGNAAYVDVSAQIIANCTVSVIEQPPTYQVVPGQALGQENGRLGVNCTDDTPYVIELGPGSYGSDAAAPSRYMCNANCDSSSAAANGIAYQIFQDAGETAPWGDTIGTNTIGGTGRGMAPNDTIEVPFYLDSPPGESVSNEVAAGEASYYSDQVLVTVSY